MNTIVPILMAALMAWWRWKIWGRGWRSSPRLWMDSKRVNRKWANRSRNWPPPQTPSWPRSRWGFPLENHPRFTDPPFTSSSLQSTMMLCGVALFLAFVLVSVSMHNSTGVCFSMSWWRLSKAVAWIVCKLRVSLFLGPKERELTLFVSFCGKSSTQQQSNKYKVCKSTVWQWVSVCRSSLTFAPHAVKSIFKVLPHYAVSSVDFLPSPELSAAADWMQYMHCCILYVEPNLICQTRSALLTGSSRDIATCPW